MPTSNLTKRYADENSALRAEIAALTAIVAELRKETMHWKG
jgi:hypothetical protein